MEGNHLNGSGFGQITIENVLRHQKKNGQDLCAFIVANYLHCYGTCSLVRTSPEAAFAEEQKQGFEAK